MAVDYTKLWKLLIDKKMNKSQLREAAHISTNAGLLMRLKKKTVIT